MHQAEKDSLNREVKRLKDELAQVSAQRDEARAKYEDVSADTVRATNAAAIEIAAMQSRL